jgi:hypothetical protein
MPPKRTAKKGPPATADKPQRLTRAGAAKQGVEVAPDYSTPPLAKRQTRKPARSNASDQPADQPAGHPADEHPADGHLAAQPSPPRPSTPEPQPEDGSESESVADGEITADAALQPAESPFREALCKSTDTISSLGTPENQSTPPFKQQGFFGSQDDSDSEDSGPPTPTPAPRAPLQEREPSHVEEANWSMSAAFSSLLASTPQSVLQTIDARIAAASEKEEPQRKPHVFAELTEPIDPDEFTRRWQDKTAPHVRRSEAKRANRDQQDTRLPASSAKFDRKRNVDRQQSPHQEETDLPAKEFDRKRKVDRPTTPEPETKRQRRVSPRRAIPSPDQAAVQETMQSSSLDITSPACSHPPASRCLTSNEVQTNTDTASDEIIPPGQSTPPDQSTSFFSPSRFTSSLWNSAAKVAKNLWPPPRPATPGRAINREESLRGTPVLKNPHSVKKSPDSRSSSPEPSLGGIAPDAPSSPVRATIFPAPHLPPMSHYEEFPTPSPGQFSPPQSARRRGPPSTVQRALQEIAENNRNKLREEERQERASEDEEFNPTTAPGRGKKRKMATGRPADDDVFADAGLANAGGQVTPKTPVVGRAFAMPGSNGSSEGNSPRVGATYKVPSEAGSSVAGSPKLSGLLDTPDRTAMSIDNIPPADIPPEPACLTKPYHQWTLGDFNEFVTLEAMNTEQIQAEIRSLEPGELPLSFVKTSATIKHYEREAIKELERWKKDTQHQMRCQLEAARDYEMSKFRDQLPLEIKNAKEQMEAAKVQAQAEKARWDAEKLRLETLVADCQAELDFVRQEMGVEWEHLRKKKALLNAHANGVGQWEEAANVSTSQDGSLADMSAAVYHEPQPSSAPAQPLKNGNDRPSVTWGKPERREKNLESPGPNQPPNYSAPPPTPLKPVLKVGSKMSKASKAARASRASNASTPLPDQDTSEDELPAGLTEHQRESYKRKMNDVKKYTPRQSSNLRNVEGISNSPSSPASVGGPVRESHSTGGEGHPTEHRSPQRDRARAEDPSTGGEGHPTEHRSPQRDRARVEDPSPGGEGQPTEHQSPQKDRAHVGSAPLWQDFSDPEQYSDNLKRALAEARKTLPEVKRWEISWELDEEEIEYRKQWGNPEPQLSENYHVAIAKARAWEDELRQRTAAEKSDGGDKEV